MRGTLLAFLVLATLNLGHASAPINDQGTNQQNPRVPANESVQAVRSFEHYLDLDCNSLITNNSTDPFIKYFSKSMADIDSNICRQVILGEMVYGDDSDVSQSDREFIGAGTFSHLLETHYREFISSGRLDYYQSLNCYQLTDAKSEDGFIRFFRGVVTKRNPQLCDLVGPFQDMDSDVAEATKPTIGLGTFSNMVEVYFDEYVWSL